MTMQNNEHELNMERQYDALERALAARPLVRAPRNTAARVMARIAALPQQNPVATYAPPPVVPIRYTPPAALPLPELDDTEQEMRRRLTKLVFTVTWVSLSALFIYLVLWPLASNLLLGAHNDMNIISRAVQLWNGGVTLVGDLFTAIAPYLPSVMSAVAGLAIMLLVFRMQRHNWRTE